MNKKQFKKVLIVSFFAAIPVYLFLSYFLWGSFYHQNLFDDESYTSSSMNENQDRILSLAKECAYPHKIYSRDSISTDYGNKISYIIDIDTTYSSYELDQIADYYAGNEYSNRVFVEFYLSDQSKAGTNYALSKRTPEERSTQINYVAPPKECELEETSTNVAPFKGCKTFGKWDLGVGGYTVIYKKQGQCYMCNVFSEGKYEEPELFYETSFRGYKAFINADDDKDMYVIVSGNLYGYYDGEKAAEFHRIK